MQEILIAILFLTSSFFVGRKIFLEFSAKNGCAKGCGECGLENKGASNKAIQS